VSFELRRGTNVSHWLSQSERRGAERRAWFSRADVERIASTGLDHVRIPLDEEQLWDEQGAREQEAFELLEEALEWCEAAALRVVVDLHVLRSHDVNKPRRPLFLDPAEQERLCFIWRDLSAALRHRSVEQLAYELLNEPVAPTDEEWNALAARLLAEIRAREPERVVALGSNDAEDPTRLPALRIPQDSDLILAFHFYEPMLITHYRAPWNAMRGYEGPVAYPGELVSRETWDELPEPVRLTAHGRRVFDAQTIERLLEPALAVARAHDLSLWCGEFGAMPTVPARMREQWYRDLLAAFARHGIAWSNWDYKGEFGLFTPDGEATAILPLLTAAA
jgi:endoglucanase